MLCLERTSATYSGTLVLLLGVCFWLPCHAAKTKQLQITSPGCADEGAHWQRVTDDTCQAGLGLFLDLRIELRHTQILEEEVPVAEWSVYWFIEQVQLQLTVHLRTFKLERRLCVDTRGILEHQQFSS
jgi:hypothetical protein